ncbi:CHAD domain containing protein [Prosthecochloris aestuarii DSM 271]|uniref:CHAD domain containing protein n=1 Tax=Prosthecochloris aestuarii (strain DSM 271 / SK 413) TaxID=290512 RepID=B4S7N2_PROA2|nr:CHAD domain-containing protein [Prosthecochloris aestuarii]ACF46069.1 CHAD domain containing protein [Prosthecochloris aestuarii DSM 271]
MVINSYIRKNHTRSSIVHNYGINPGVMRQHHQPVLFRIRSTSTISSLIEPFLLKQDASAGIEQLATSHETVTFFDTFESQARKKNKGLIKKRNRLCLIDLKTGSEIVCCDFRKNPVFFLSGETAGSPIAPLLREITTLRAWIRLCSIEERVETFKVLDENQKTIATLSVMLFAGKKAASDATADPEVIDAAIKILPVRGYDEKARELASTIEASEESAGSISFTDIYHRILASATLMPLHYSSKPSAKLDPKSDIHDSARRLLLETLQIMKINEPWLTKNIDTEFLHDYRVAIRRSRSILAQLKGIFPPQQLRYFQQELRTLAKRTNNLRDQDVYLLEADTFSNLLPAHLRDHLELFFNDLKSARRSEHRSFSRYLRSQRHELLIEAWESFLHESAPPDIAQAPNSRQSTAAIAVFTIRKAWKKVLRHGRSTSPKAMDSELHALRIDCKKLRYLLEFFSSIFPPKTIGPVIRHLKKLQDNLGQFVDLSVQQDYLDLYLANLEHKPDNTGIAAAIGGLITTLYHEREEVRNQFHTAFNHFDSNESEALFTELFHQYRNA